LGSLAHDTLTGGCAKSRFRAQMYASHVTYYPLPKHFSANFQPFTFFQPNFSSGADLFYDG